MSIPGFGGTPGCGGNVTITAGMGGGGRTYSPTEEEKLLPIGTIRDGQWWTGEGWQMIAPQSPWVVQYHIIQNAEGENVGLYKCFQTTDEMFSYSFYDGKEIHVVVPRVVSRIEYETQLAFETVPVLKELSTKGKAVLLGVDDGTG